MTFRDEDLFRSLGRLLKRIVGLFPPRHSVLLSGPGVSMCP